MQESQPWREKAACIGVGPNIFFSKKMEHINIAKYICSSCIVKSECLDYSLNFAHNDMFGIWGGTGTFTRRKIKAQRERETKKLKVD